MVESVQGPKSRLAALWPAIHDADDAASASRMAVWACGFSVIVTVIASLLRLWGAGFTGLCDASMFALLGFGIYRMSRLAAVMALLLFIAERVAMYSTTRSTGGVVAIVMLLCLGNGMPGTFAYHRLRGQVPVFPKDPEPPQAWPMSRRPNSNRMKLPSGDVRARGVQEPGRARSRRLAVCSRFIQPLLAAHPCGALLIQVHQQIDEGVTSFRACQG